MRRPWSGLCPAAFIIFCQIYLSSAAFAAGPSGAFSHQAPVVPFSNSNQRPDAQPSKPVVSKPVVITLVTIEQLQQLLVASRGASDSKIAEQLSSLELAERLGNPKLATMTAELRGKKARQALTAIADVSEFLDHPQPALSADAPPDSATQSQMISLAQSYLHDTIPKLPDFTATRTVVSYEETPQNGEDDITVDYKPLHFADRYTEKVLYRDGHEVTNASEKSKTPGPESRYLITRGTFGPFLGWIADAIAVPNSLTWNRWEQSGSGLLAVFRYQVPVENSRFQIKGCCLPDGGEVKGFIKTTGYSGEIAIDPRRGAILRLVFRADLRAIPPLVRSDIMVEYGPVDIGGKTYICPVRSVSLWRGRSVIPLTGSNGKLGTFGPYVTALNDMTFDNYHIFRSESRILPGFKPAQ